MDTFDNFDAHEPGLYQGMPNIFGGSDIYHNGELVQATMPNVFGGVDVYDGECHLQGNTMPNVFGGEDYWNFGGNTEHILSYEDPLQHASECQFPHLKLS